MPDFKKITQALQETRAAANNQAAVEKYEEGQEKYSEEKSPQEMIKQNYVDTMKEQQAAQNPKPIDERDMSYDTSQISRMAAGRSDAEQGLRDTTANTYGDANMYKEEQVRGKWNPEQIYQDFLSKSADNVMVGLGNMIGDYGNIAQVLGGALPGVSMYESNPLAKALQELGGEISEANMTYITPEMRSPEFKFSTFINPEFWAVHGAQFVPQILEILATQGIASGAAKGAGAITKGLLKETLAEGSEAIAKKGLKTTVTTLRQGTVELPGKTSMLGKFVRDTGELTTLGESMVKGVTGGLVTNLRVSLANAGEVYNTYKDIKDPQGNPYFSKEELGQMAASAFGNNMSYVLADIASWGMTFGGGWEQLGKGIGGAASKLNNKVLGRKIVGGMFTQEVSPAIKKIAGLAGNKSKWAAKALAEGGEETIQESWEEWSKFKAYKEKSGTWKGYNGVTEDYDNFFDYYTSKDSEAIRAISFGLGAAAGGGFNIKTLINKQADQAYKMFDANEALKQGVAVGSKDRAMQDLHLRERMAELVFQNKEYAFGGFMAEMQERGVVDENQLANYSELFDQMQQTKSSVSNLNIKGKYAFMLNVARQQDIDNKIEIEKNKYTGNVQVLEQQLGKDSPEFQEALKVEQNKFKEQLHNLAYISDQLNQNKVKILTGKPAKKIEYDVEEDENGNFQYVVRNDNAEAEINSEGVEVKPVKKTLLGKLGEKAQALVSGISEEIDKFLGTEEKAPEITPEQNEALKAEKEKQNEITNFDLNDLLRPNGAIGTQGVSEIQANDFLKSIGVNIPEVNSFKDIVEYLKANPEERQKVVDFTNQNPLEINELPDGTFHLQDGHHRATMLYHSGVTNVSAKLKDAGVYNPKYKKEKPATTASTNPQPTAQSQEEFLAEVYGKNKNINLEPQTKKMTNDVFREFTDTGVIPSGIINAIVDKMFAGKKLTKREEAVRAEFNADIEQILKQRQTEQDVVSETIQADEQVSEQEASYIKKAVKRKSKTRTLSTEEKEYRATLKDKTVQSNPNENNDVFDRTGNARVDDSIGAKVKQAIASVSTKEGIFAKLRGLKASLGQDFANFKKEELLDKAKSAFDNAINFDGDYDMDTMRFSQMIAMNEKLNLMFPDAGVHVTNVNNISEMVGFPTMGYTLAGAIYIDDNSWKQDKVFMHEAAHIFYQLAPDDPYVNTIVNHAMKNKALLDTVLANYDGQLYYELTNNKGEVVRIRKVKIKQRLLQQGVITSLSQADAAINYMVKNNELKEIPLAEQPIIREELFAFTLEGPLSENYNKFFELKDEPVRKYLAKGFWKKIKQRAVDAKQKYQSSDAVYFQTLSPESKLEYNDAKTFVLDKIVSGMAGKDLSPVGRAKYEEQNAQKVNEQLSDIRERLSEETSNYFDQEKALEKDRARRMKNALEAGIEIEEYNSDDSNFFEVDRIKYVQKASKIIGLFAQNYNKVRRLRFYNKNKNKAVDWSKMPYFDKDKLQIALFDLAKKSYSNEDFIMRIENPDAVEEIFEFNKFLDEVRPDDKLLTLSSMKFILGNQSNINSVVGYVSANGTYNLENNLNYREKAAIENIQEDLYGAAAQYFSKQADASRYVKFIQTIEKIKSKNYTEDDLYEFLDMFNTYGSLNIKEIMEENRINVNGKNFTVDTVVNEVINKVFNQKAKNNSALNTYSILDPATNKGLNPILRTFIKSLVATNRKYTADYTVQNALENQEPIRVIDNFMTRELERLEHSALSMPRSKFLAKFSNVTSSGTGSKSNALLNYIYDQVNSGNKIDLNQFHGVRNDNTGQNNTIKESSSAEQSVFEMLTFLNSDRKDSYMMETGRYSDSPTSYMLRVPKIDFDKNAGFVGGQLKLKKTPLVENVFKTYKDLNGANDFAQFEKMLFSEINEEVAFMESNYDSFKNIASTKKLFNANGKLNAEGKLKVADYVLNQVVNGINFSEIFFPSFDINDLSKRSKSGRSPGLRLGKHVQIESIYFVDDMVNGQSVSDSGIYILREDAELLERAGGNLMPLNKSYKILNTGVEHTNPNFEKKNIFDKGYATIIDDEMVKQNPKLKGLYDFMRQRRATYIDAHGPISQDLLNGVPTHFMYAAPVSSNKSNNFPDALVTKDGNPTEKGNLFTLDALNNSTFEEQNEMLDKWYYKDGEFLGLSGDNFVVQQIMDKESFEVNTPIQMVRAILTNSAVEGSLELAEEIQSLIVQEQQSNLEEFRIAMNSENPELIREFIKDRIDLESVDPLQRFLIVNDIMSMNVPALRELAKNTLSNAIRLAGNKLKTPGGLAQAKAATYEKPYATNGSKQLQFYGKKSDGGHTKGEAVLPAFMNKNAEGRGAVVAREYLVQDSKSDKNRPLSFLEVDAKAKAMKRNVGYFPVYNDAGIQIGFYVEGDTVIATRIPSHGPQTTGVFEVVDFDSTGAANVQLPSEFALKITGGDYDGDQFFIQHKGGKSFEKWNNAFEKLTNHWLSPQMASEVLLPIDFKQEAEQAIADVEKVYGKKDAETMYFSPAGRRKNFNNTLISKGNIGVSANLHSLIGMLSAYQTPLINKITINGVTADVFQDSASESRTINSAKIFNIILDNAKMQYADKLGINEYTISQAMILRNLGFSLSDIGLILNSEPVMRINAMMMNNDSIYTEKKTIYDIIEKVRTEMKLKQGKEKNKSIDTKNLKSFEQKNAVLDLMANLGAINEEIMAISTVMQGHNKLENNPFILNNQMEKFTGIINNNKNIGIKVPAELAQNPLVQNYVNVFDFNMAVQKQLDPVHSKVGIDVFEAITNGIGKTLSNNGIRKVHNDIEAFLSSRLLGLNNLGEEEMKKTVDKALSGIAAHIKKLQNDIIEHNDEDVRLSISAFDNSLLFRKALRFSKSGFTKYVSLNNQYFNENLSLEERKRILEEFAALPQDLKNDLIVYDLVQNNWKGPQSLFHLFEKEFKQKISDAANEQIVNRNEKPVSKKVENELIKRLVQTNSNLFTMRQYPFDKTGDLTLEFIQDTKNKGVLAQMLKGKEVIFRYEDSAGKQKIFHFKGWKHSQEVDLSQGINPNQYMEYLRQNIKKSIYAVYDAGAYKSSIGVTSIQDESTMPTGERKTLNLDDFKASDDDSFGMARREVASDYYNFTQTLSQKELMQTLQINNTEQVSELRQAAIYEKYLADKAKADQYAKLYNTESVKKLSEEKLIDLFSGAKSVDGEQGFGYRDKIAYASVIRPIIMEIANRAGVEQQAHFNNPGYKGEDLGFFQSYLMANNIPSGQPEIQALVRRMETEFRKFQKEKTKYVSQINSATEALYKEQFGYNPNSRKPFEFLKSLYNKLFKDPKDMYMKLYGPLIDFQEVVNEYGQKIQNMKYKSPADIEKGLADGTISQAQYNFYKTTHGITEYLKPFVLNGSASREDYIPHTAPAWLEIKSRRGMLGLAVHSKSIDERIYDVTMKFKNPITGNLEEDVPFSHIENIYNTISKGKGNVQDAKDFLLLKRRALRLAKEGKNEDGSTIRLSNVEAGSSIGDTFMNRFASSRSIASTDLPSLDLNKAFVDYTHSALFNNGNENFSGMNQMLPLVDGILALNDARGDKNAKEYVDKIWKQYFLAGSKQELKGPKSSTLGALGITNDSVIDFLTKASLVYWLGWKGLALGYGVYAVGNVLIGKYTNIMKVGGAAWAKGEQRFWSGNQGFNILNPFRGVQESNAILKTAGYMDINVFDNVNMEEKNSIEKSLISLALFPMTWSERWIQGVDFLGRITDQEWNTLKSGQRLPDARMNELENEVKNNHGKGYHATDQRMIQMYSWGRNFLQFSRYIPTLFYDQFGKDDINIYGKRHMGTYTALGKTVQKGIRGEWSPTKFFEYRKNLESYERKRLDQGLMGFGMLSLMFGLDYAGHKGGESGFFADANPLMNADKMESKFTPRSMIMIENMMR